VALRAEPFGALAYHYGNRRLHFLRSPELVDVVRRVGDHPDVVAALEACGIDRRRWPVFTRALAALAASDFLQPVGGTASPGSSRPVTGGVSPTGAGRPGHGPPTGADPPTGTSAQRTSTQQTSTQQEAVS
jgi:putative mycofactocin binding protein MftB